MYFEEDKLYHVYNRAVDKHKLFYTRENYLYFLRKVEKHLEPYCEFLAWCLMPNHFHFLIMANEETVKTVIKAKKKRNVFSEGTRVMLSSYTRAINLQEYRRGSLLNQNTKAKSLNDEKNNETYAFDCFQYIHQNPVKAGLVERMEDWKFSSFRYYAGFTGRLLCNKELAAEIINFDAENFVEQSYAVLGRG